MSQEGLGPREATEFYLDDRADELRVASYRSIASRLERFVEWCEQEGIADLTELSGRDLRRFKLWRKEDGNLTVVSLNGQLATLSVFIEFCEEIDAVESDLSEKVPVPNVSDEAEISDERVEPDQAAEILSYLQKFQYASRQHVEFQLLWETGIRVGAARALDVDDYNTENCRLTLVHRPEQGTPLKNGRAGQRWVNISSDLSMVIDDYLDQYHPEVTDEYDRRPLFATTEGRIATTTARMDLYKLTRPCVYQNVCPHDREIADCKAQYNRYANECPSSTSPHPVRRGSIMHQLDQGVPKEILSDRVDVSKPVLDKHYDLRSEERKSQRRREVLQGKLDGYES